MGGPGSGAKPKVDDASLVERVRSLYAAGLTQAEVGAALELSQKAVFGVMRRNGISARVAAKRDQRGERNTAWRGDSAAYSALHLRVASVRGKPRKCEDCGTTTARRYEWASLTKNYADVMDYRRLCASCHRRFDGIVSNLGGGRRCSQSEASSQE